MSKTIQYLAIALIIQCLLLATVLFGKSQQNANPTAKLMDFDASLIDSINIKGDEGELLLLKQDDKWILPNYGNLPTVADKVENAVKDLASLKVSWPVATSESAAKRFEVDDEKPQKTIKLKSGKEIVANMYLGTSPGYRKVHARTSDSDDIYAVEFSQHSVSNKSEDWFDKTLLKYKGELSSVKVGQSEIVKSGENWQLTGITADDLDVEKLNTWVKRFNNFQVNKLIEGDLKEKIIVMDPATSVTLEGDSGLSTLVFYRKDELIYTKEADKNELFEIAEYQAKPILDMKPDNFIKREGSDDAENSEAKPEEEAPPMLNLFPPM